MTAPARTRKKRPSRDRTEDVARRDENLAVVAYQKAAMPGIGDPIWHPGERVKRVEQRPRRVYGEDETLFLLWTTSLDGRGRRTNGRCLVAQSERAFYLFGGLFWVEERGHRCVQSVWVEPEYRGRARHVRTGQGAGAGVGDLLAQMAHEAGVDCAFAPASTSGAAWARHHGFALRK